MRRVASYLNIPESLVEAAALLYRKTVEKGLIRGRLIEAVVSVVRNVRAGSCSRGLSDLNRLMRAVASDNLWQEAL